LWTSYALELALIFFSMSIGEFAYSTTGKGTFDSYLLAGYFFGEVGGASISGFSTHY
jgi:hypothetical protein